MIKDSQPLASTLDINELRVRAFQAKESHSVFLSGIQSLTRVVDQASSPLRSQMHDLHYGSSNHFEVDSQTGRVSVYLWFKFNTQKRIDLKFDISHVNGTQEISVQNTQDGIIRPISSSPVSGFDDWRHVQESVHQEILKAIDKLLS
jgi:hypothetical protein